jgi:hypothetical protein
VKEYEGLTDAAIRQDVIAPGEPAILRGLVRSWPAVRHGQSSAAQLVSYLQGFDTGAEVDAIMTPPEAGGRIFYNDSMNGFNFIRNRLPLSAVAEQVLRYAAFPHPPAVAAQSALIRDAIPGFAAENHLMLLGDAILPRIWLGNAITTPAHFDEWNNIACVVAGWRRFTLFPPDQIVNLYPGPVDFAPTGAPMSLVQVTRPDFERFPRFRTAQAAARIAELGPGDAIYIPPAWWHHVESLSSFNLLVNYWWGGTVDEPRRSDSAFDCLLHCLVNLRQLPPTTRAAWGSIFAHYVFGPDDAVAGHIPPECRGILGGFSGDQAARLRAQLAKRLQG